MRSFNPCLGVFLVVFVFLGSGRVPVGGAESSRPHPTHEESPHATYAVVSVAPDDVLNIRAKPDVDAAVVGMIPSYGVDVQIRQSGKRALGSAWVPIRYGDLTGWVNGRYLAPQAGCKDETVSARAGRIMWALKQKDMQTLSRLVHPEKGVRFSPYTYVRNEDLAFQASETRGLMSGQTVLRWGYFDGTGSPIDLTFSAYFLRFIYDADFTSPQQVGCNTVIGKGNTINNISAFYPNAVFMEYYIAGTDPQQSGMDWRSLRLVLEAHKGTWYLVGIVHDEWTT